MAKIMSRILIAKLLSLFIFLCIVIYLSYKLGERNEWVRLEKEISSINSMHAFNHWMALKEIGQDIEKGCFEEVIVKIEHEKSLGIIVIADHFEKHGNTWLTKYINDRDPNLLSNMDYLKSKYVKAREKPVCKK